ncbi:MAG: tetratricopeptide repeat protein [Verrucomicrobia bacterium]|nr:tetratricopeptide repeat protein [Verrucomicrobiota bacterium]
MSSRFDHLEFESYGEDSSVELETSQSHLDRYSSRATEAFEFESFPEALKLYARILDFDRQSHFSWKGQIQCLIQLSRSQDALNWVSLALDEFPNDDELIALKAIALARTGLIEEAMAFSDASLQSTQSNSPSWLARTEILLAQDDPTANYCQDRALNADMTSWQIPWMASRMYSFYHKEAAALKLAQMAIERAPTHSTPWLQTGRSQAALGLDKQANQSLARALELTPDSSIIADAIQSMPETNGFARILSGLGFGKRMT